MAVCCQDLPLVALGSHTASSVPVGALFKKFAFFKKMHLVFQEFGFGMFLPMFLVEIAYREKYE